MIRASIEEKIPAIISSNITPKPQNPKTPKPLICEKIDLCGKRKMDKMI